MRGIPDIEPIDTKKCLNRFQGDLFRKYAPVQRLISVIPGKLTTFFIKFREGRFVTSTISPGENQRNLFDMVSDSKAGIFGGFSTW